MSIGARKQILTPVAISHDEAAQLIDTQKERVLFLRGVDFDPTPGAAGKSDTDGPKLHDRSEWLAWYKTRASSDQGPERIIALVTFSEPFEPQILSIFAAMRDLSGIPIIVRALKGAHWTQTQSTQLRSLGFTGHGDEQNAYAFNIATYKETPEWLNSRNWANPEMWDKYRW